MGTHLGLFIVDAEGAAATSLSRLVKALSSWSGVVPGTWKVEAQPADDRSKAAIAERARREKWRVMLGELAGSEAVLDLLASTQQSGLRLSVDTRIARFYLHANDRSQPRSLRSRVCGDVELDMHKAGRRFFEGTPSDELGPLFLELLEVVASGMKPRAIRTFRDDREYAPPLSTMSWYANDDALREDLALTEEWLSDVTREGLLDELCRTFPDVALLVSELAKPRAGAAPALTAARFGVSSWQGGWLLFDEDLDPAHGSLVRVFASLTSG